MVALTTSVPRFVRPPSSARVPGSAAASPLPPAVLDALKRLRDDKDASDTAFPSANKSSRS
jgi:hypothetical protein